MRAIFEIEFQWANKENTDRHSLSLFPSFESACLSLFSVLNVSVFLCLGLEDMNSFQAGLPALFPLFPPVRTALPSYFCPHFSVFLGVFGFKGRPDATVLRKF